MNKIVYVFILFISTNLFAQISVETDTTKIRIGEQLTYSIIVPKQENITFPSLVLEGLEVAEESNKQTLAQNIVKKYYITGFDTGAFYIKKQEVFINAKSYFTDSLLINVAGVKIDTAKIQQSLKSKIAEEEKITFSEIANRYGIFVILFLAIPLLLIILNYFLKKKKKNKPKIIIPPFVTATKELEELESKQLWQKNKTKTYYSELTDIVRKYLGDELSVNALETTTEELINSLESINKKQKIGLKKETIHTLKKLLSQADFVKFAKQKPLEHEIKGHQSDAKTIVNTVHQIVSSKKTEENNEVQ